MLGHLLAVEIGERSQRYSIGDAFAQLAIIPVLHPHQNQCAQHLRRGEAAATVVRLFEAAHQIAPYPLNQRPSGKVQHYRRPTGPAPSASRMRRTICVPWRQQVSGRAPEKDGKPEARPAWTGSQYRLPRQGDLGRGSGIGRMNRKPGRLPGLRCCQPRQEDRQFNPPGPGAATGRLRASTRRTRGGSHIKSNVLSTDSSIGRAQQS
jgi:hypothetical protein